MKVARTVWSRGKDRDNLKILPIAIKTFKKLAENCSKYLQKGHLVAVKGHIKTGSYQKDGKTQYTLDIIGDDVRFLEGKKNSGQNNQSTSNQENNNQNQFNQNDEDPFASSGSLSDEPWPFG